MQSAEWEEDVNKFMKSLKEIKVNRKSLAFLGIWEDNAKTLEKNQVQVHKTLASSFLSTFEDEVISGKSAD